MKLISYVLKNKYRNTSSSCDGHFVSIFSPYFKVIVYSFNSNGFSNIDYTETKKNPINKKVDIIPYNYVNCTDASLCFDTQ